MWKELKIGRYECKIMPLNLRSKPLPDCTKDAQEVTKIRGNKEPDTYMLKGTTTTVQKPTHKLVGERAIPPAGMTKTVKEEKIEKAYTTKLVGSEATFLVKNDLLKEHVEKEGPITFPFVAGRGWKVCRAIVQIFEHNNKKYLVMTSGRKLITELPLDQLIQDTKGTEPTDKATEEELELLATI